MASPSPRDTNRDGKPLDSLTPHKSGTTLTPSAPAMLRAYSDYIAEHGHKPSVRALREQAGCSTGAAAAWLREEAPNVTIHTETPPVPTDALTPALEPLWAVAYGKAREIVTVQHQMDLEAARSSERAALAENGRLREELEAKVADAQHEVDRLRAIVKHERHETEIRIIEAEGEMDYLHAELERERRETERQVAKASAQAVAAMDETRGAESKHEPGQHLHVLVTDPTTGRTIEYKPTSD